MKANPGGEIDIADIVGRDELVEEIWGILSVQSVLLTAERRIGKTTILKKMRDQAPENFICIYQDLEGYTTPEEFVHSVGTRVKANFKWFNKAKHEGASILQRFAGAQAQGVRLPDARNANWKQDLVAHIKNVHLEQNERLVFLWDEMPLMLHNIKKQADMSVARDVLDLLRKLRQEYGVRMVLTGSIGLHHVISDLHSQGNANAPVNDLRQVEVTPLSIEHGSGLALSLLKAEGIESDNPVQLANNVAKDADYIPYYIHHFIIELKKRARKCDPLVLQELIEQCLLRANDPWNLRYYRSRIDIYYDDEQAAIAIEALNHLCKQQTPQSAEQIFAALKSRIKIKESKRDLVREIMRTLERDHYLTGSETGSLSFRSSLVKRWWEKQQ